MSADAFFRAAERAASLPLLDDAVWIEAWRDIFRPVPSALAALRRLAEDVTPILISNTNTVHWDGVLRVAPELTRLVPLRALSFEVGAAKPEPALFHAALARAGARPSDALYADDRPELVEAARAMGIDGFVVRNPDAFADELQRRGFLAPGSVPLQSLPAQFGGTASPLFVQGLEEFRAGRFFEAHEAWELLWKDSAGDDKLLFQALIQLAAACVHIGRGNAAPGRRLLALAKSKLDQFGDDKAGVDVQSLRREIGSALAEAPEALLRVDLRGRFPI